jgi:hypothetical protein
MEIIQSFEMFLSKWFVVIIMVIVAYRMFKPKTKIKK